MDAVARGVVISRPQGAPVGEYLVRDRRVNRTHLKGRLPAAGLKRNRCERCGIEDWLGEPLAMGLHHVNGEGTDNRLLISGRPRQRRRPAWVRMSMTCRRRTPPLAVRPAGQRG